MNFVTALSRKLFSRHFTASNALPRLSHIVRTGENPRNMYVLRGTFRVGARIGNVIQWNMDIKDFDGRRGCERHSVDVVWEYQIIEANPPYRLEKVQEPSQEKLEVVDVHYEPGDDYAYETAKEDQKAVDAVNGDELKVVPQQMLRFPNFKDYNRHNGFWDVEHNGPSNTTGFNRGSLVHLQVVDHCESQNLCVSTDLLILKMERIKNMLVRVSNYNFGFNPSRPPAQCFE